MRLLFKRGFLKHMKKILFGLLCVFTCVTFLGCYIPKNDENPTDNSQDSVFSRDDTSDIVSVNFTIADSNQMQSYENEPLSDIIERVSESVVTVEAESSSGKTYGSGVVIATSDDNSTSYIAISHHIIVGAQTVGVKAKGDTKIRLAKPIGTDPETDLCVIAVSGTLKKVVFYPENTLSEKDEGKQETDVETLQAEGTQNRIKAGKSVISVADPFGMGYITASRGIVSMVGYMADVGEGKYTEYMLTDAFVNENSTGGGLFTEQGGYLAGIITDGINNKSKWNGFVLPVETVQCVCAEIIENGYVLGRYKLGFTVEDNRSGWGITESIKVTDVAEDGSFYADGNGLRKGDLIRSFSYKGTDYDISKSEQLYGYFYDTFVSGKEVLSVGDKIKFKIERNGTEQEIDLVIKQYDYFGSDRN